MTTAGEDSEQLIHGIQSGSVADFDQFYETHVSFVYHMSLKMTKNKAEAEDLCHDVFVEVFRQAEKFDASRGSVKAWLAIKTKSRFIDRERKAKRSVLGLERADVPDGQPLIDDIVCSNWERDQVLAAIERLPMAQQKAVYGKYFEYQTQKEISTVMNKPIGTVKSLIRYGLINLRRQLVKSGWSEPSGGDPTHGGKM